MASIAMQNVTKVFDRRTTAISNFTLDVRDGEFMVLVGPSGCGKTTILRLIAGLESPTAGEIRIADRTANGVPPRDRDVAMVFQDGVLYPHLSVYDNLAFPLRMRGQRRAEVRRRVDAVVEMLGLADLVNRKPAALSGGQRQRVALGRAVVREPAVFLFDEPLSSLDPALRLAMREEIKALHRKLHTTMLYVTHDQSEAMALGERVCVLREGQIQQVGQPGEVYDRPANRFVAGFFGTPPMNFLTGCIRWENGVGFVELAAGRVPLPRSMGVPPMDSGSRAGCPCYARLASSLADFGDKTVLVGVRPHDLSLEPSPQQRINALPGRVSLLEPFGSRTDAHVMLLSGEKCIISLPPHSQLKLGEEVRMYVDSDKLHLFECGGRGLMRPRIMTGG